MVGRGFSPDEFAKLVNEIVRSSYNRARITKPGGWRYLWQDGARNGLAEMLVRPANNDVLVRFIPSSSDSTRARTGEAFAYDVDSTKLIARAIIDWINDRDRTELDRIAGRKY